MAERNYSHMPTRKEPEEVRVGKSEGRAPWTAAGVGPSVVP